VSRSIRVRLNVSLTEYHPSLKAGTEGVTVDTGGEWSRHFDRFTGVRFPEAGVRDILWQSLEIVDEEYLQEKAEEKRRLHEALRTATDVVLRLGPNGGFRGFSYELELDGRRQRGVAYSREEADELIAVLEKYGIPVEEVREPRQRRY